MSRLKTLAAATAAFAALTAGPPAAGAQTTLAQELQPFEFATSRSIVAWSSWDPQARIYRLVVLRDGQRSVLPVPGSAQPFDVDLGTSRSGTLIAVYSREVDESRDLFRYSFADGTETRLATLSRPNADEREPTVSRDEIGFVRASATTNRLMLANTTSTRAPRTIVSRTLRKGIGPQITHPDLSVGRLSYVLTSAGRYGFPREAVHVRTVRSGRDRVIHVAQSGGANFAHVTGPAWSDDGRGLYFARTNEGSGQGNRYIRYLPASGELGYAPGRRDAFSTAWLGAITEGTLLVSGPGIRDCSTGAAPGVCTLQSTGPLQFSPKP